MDQLKEHPQIVELLDTLDKNGLMKEKSEVQSLVSYIGGMEETLTGMLGELQDMRREINLIHNNTLRSKCHTLVEKTESKIRQGFSAVKKMKDNLIQSAGNAVRAFREKGRDALAESVRAMKIPEALDKLSAIAVDKGVQPVIVCTKADLGEAEFLRSAYERSTLPFIAIHYDTGEGLDEVKQWINGRLCAFCGNSGVGKSTLLNALLPEAERETSAISQKLGRGRHTTREVTIFEAFGGRIADTPGFASLEANRAGFIPKENLEHVFPEFGPYLGECQFTGCSHRSEKGCAVRAALAEGKLSQTRYDSYCAMYEEVKDVKDWQRPKV